MVSRAPAKMSSQPKKSMEARVTNTDQPKATVPKMTRATPKTRNHPQLWRNSSRSINCGLMMGKPTFSAMGLSP